MRRSQGGFSLMELMVVVLIIGILGAIAVPLFNNQRVKARNGVAKKALLDAAGGLSAYQADNDNFNNFSIAPNATFPYEPSLTGIPWESATGGCSITCVSGPASNPRKIAYFNNWTNTSRNGDQTSIALCAAGRGDRAYCILKITEADSNFNLSPGTYYNASTPGEDTCGATGYNGYPVDSVAQAWCGMSANGYPTRWNDD